VISCDPERDIACHGMLIVPLLSPFLDHVPLRGLQLTNRP